MKKWYQAVLSKKKKEQIVVWILLLLLLAVVLWPTDTQKKSVSDEKEQPETEGVEPQNQEERMEEVLADTLSQVKGVGAVRVALTLESTNRKIVEKDIPDTQSSEKRTGDGESSESTASSKEETTVYEKDGNGTEIPYVISEEFPRIRGVLVVAEGGDQPVVIQEIQEAVMALFDVDAHKIKVMKMKERSAASGKTGKSE